MMVKNRKREVTQTFYSYIETSFGKILLLSQEQSLVGLYFISQKNIPTLDKYMHYAPKTDIFLSTFTQLNEYMKGTRQEFNINYKFIGTDFQKKVWSKIATISYGQTSAYKDIAAKISLPKAVRAVSSAIGRNPISIIVPCHRIIGSDGSLKGYAAGLDLKSKILNLEKAI